MLNQETGAAVYAKAGNTRRQMASTTKIMTAAVVLDTPGIDLKRKIIVKQMYRDYVAREGASTADLRTGDELNVRQLLYAMLLPSGSDAAYALADAFGAGATTVERTASFISQMNRKAISLGLKNTRFDSFDGISPTGNTYTTPSELAKLARYAMNNAQFRTTVKTPSHTSTALAANGRTRTYTWNNTNQLLGSYRGVIGIKTGTGTAAGPCLVFAAAQGDKILVGVVLNGPDRYKDATKLLNYGFGTPAAKEKMKLRPLPPNAQRD